jgi:TM2 domain-containing membrane protein YozV
MSQYPVAPTTKYCHRCGVIIDAQAVVCPKCGVLQPTLGGQSEKKLLPAVILATPPFGILGFHRFYTGKVLTGLLMAVTFGGFGVWWLVDFVRLVIGNFTDSDGEKITDWT